MSVCWLQDYKTQEKLHFGWWDEKAHLYFTQTDVDGGFLQPNRGFALFHKPREELLNVLLQLQSKQTQTQELIDTICHSAKMCVKQKAALYLDPLRSLAVQMSRYRLRSTCFPMDKTARLDLPLFFSPNDGSIRLTTSTSHCSFILNRHTTWPACETRTDHIEVAHRVNASRVWVS